MFMYIVVILCIRLQVDGSPIVNGIEIDNTDIGDYSFMSSLQQLGLAAPADNFNHFCGGAMIHPSWILTAAHCVDGKNPQQVVAVIGERLANADNETRNKVSKILFYGYDKYSLRNDIALLKVSTTKEDYKVLPIYQERPPYGKKCKIIGYGAKEYTGKTPNPLSWAYVDLIPNGQCTSILGRIMGPQIENVCAMGNGTDTCQGDSGGPLICEIDDVDYIVGITSSGSGCGIPGVPSLYTLVQPYTNWINNVIESL